MRGTEFVNSLPIHGTSQERDDRIVAAVKNGDHAPLNWRPVKVSARGLEATVFVMSDALMIGEPGDYVRVSMNADTAQRVAWELRAFLPTTKLCDDVWDAAEIQITPCTQGPPYSEIDHPRRMLKYHQDVDKKVDALGSRGVLVGNVGKHWVLTNKNIGSTKVRNYGWYTEGWGNISASGKRMIQTLGAAHNSRHVDYSQVVRLVKNEVEINGEMRTFEEVAVHPQLCHLVSSEGVLRSLRIPGTSVPPTTEVYPQPGDDTPPDELAAPVQRELVYQRLLYRGVAPGVDVGAWQVFLRVHADNKFGPITEGATRQFQLAQGLLMDGIVGRQTINRANEMLEAAWRLRYSADGATAFNIESVSVVPAKNYTWARRGVGDIKWIVLHSMESSEKPTVAEAVAQWFAGSDAPRASAHYCVDNDSIVQSVKPEYVAWHAPGANRHGIGIEHAGRARQTKEDWFDEFSREMLEQQSAPLCAFLCKQWGVPPRFVDREGLKAGHPGVTTHNEVSQAFGKSSHWDPGPGFPMDWYLRLVHTLMG